MKKLFTKSFLRFFSLSVLGMMIGTGSARTLHWNAGRGYEPFRHSTSGGILIDNHEESPAEDSYIFDDPLKQFRLRFRASNLHGNSLKKYAYMDSDGRERKISHTEWGFYLLREAGDTIRINISSEEVRETIESVPALVVGISADSKVSEESSFMLKEGVDFHTGPNQWEILAEEGRIIVITGNRRPLEIASLEISPMLFTGFGFYACRGCELHITDISLMETLSATSGDHDFLLSREKLESLIEATPDDSMTGFWTIFDRNLEESYLKLGGQYLLAFTKEDGGYLISYLSGAKTYADKWNPGAIKGHLKTTPFEDIFDVEWIDAEGSLIDYDVKAQTGEGATLTIQFPYQSSTLRLRRIPTEKVNLDEIYR